MKLTKTLLVLAATTAFFGTTVVTASAATTDTTTIQALPNQSETQAAHDAVENDTTTTSSETTTTKTNSSTGTTSSTSHSATSTTTHSNTTASTSQAKAVVALAKQLATQNIPYVWGGESLSGMDCSGLTDYVYRHAANINLGHYTVTQEGKVTKKAVSQAQPGDLLFWGSEGATYHVAIYIGNNQFVAAPKPGDNVEVETISSYFMPSFAGKVNG